MRATAPNIVDAPAPVAGAPLGERADDDLVRLARDGRARAFEVLVDRYSRRLTEFCVRMTGDRRSGEDVAQETWLAVWRALGDYRPDGRFEAYLFTIARNRCKNSRRSARRRRRVFDEEAEPATDRGGAPAADRERAGQVEALLAHERSREVARLVAGLKPALREAVILRFALGMEYSEISAIVRRPESTVRSRVFHGLKTLRRALEREGSRA